MLIYTTGDLLNSKADALVNTVNCEGYMGKGIAYQFKQKFPNNFKEYVNACKNGMLYIGELHYSKESNKIIINFPTKRKWREKSNIHDIEIGLRKLVELIVTLDIKSIAIPPLGSGNGGLNWVDVKKIVELELAQISNSVEIYIFEPTKSAQNSDEVPILDGDAIILMEIKEHLNVFNAMRLQSTAYIMDAISRRKSYNFVFHEGWPIDSKISRISKDIKKFNEIYSISDINETKEILFNKIVSDSVISKIQETSLAIQRACNHVNSLNRDIDLQASCMICRVIEKKQDASRDHIVQTLETQQTSAYLPDRNSIIQGIEYLYNSCIIEENLIGFRFKLED